MNGGTFKKSCLYLIQLKQENMMKIVLDLKIYLFSDSRKFVTNKFSQDTLCVSHKNVCEMDINTFSKV